jgi:hypothetical protein
MRARCILSALWASPLGMSAFWAGAGASCARQAIPHAATNTVVMILFISFSFLSFDYSQKFSISQSRNLLNLLTP